MTNTSDAVWLSRKDLAKRLGIPDKTPAEWVGHKGHRAKVRAVWPSCPLPSHRCHRVGERAAGRGNELEMAGRPPLRIGQRGKISRKKLSNGAWLARCRYRDSDGVTRIVERRGLADEFDQYGKLAEDALIEALNDRRPSAMADEITLDTPLSALIEHHLERLAEDGRSLATISTYKFAVRKLKQLRRGRPSARGHTGPHRRRHSVDAGRARGDDGTPSQDHTSRCAAACRDGERPERKPGARCSAD